MCIRDSANATTARFAASNGSGSSTEDINPEKIITHKSRIPMAFKAVLPVSYTHLIPEVLGYA